MSLVRCTQDYIVIAEKGRKDQERNTWGGRGSGKRLEMFWKGRASRSPSAAACDNEWCLDVLKGAKVLRC